MKLNCLSTKSPTEWGKKNVYKNASFLPIKMTFDKFMDLFFVHCMQILKLVNCTKFLHI